MSAMHRDLSGKTVIIDPDEEGSTFSFFVGPKESMEFAADERKVRTDLVIKVTGKKLLATKHGFLLLKACRGETT